jgi:Kef-type K+ transport system membrane component KefB
MMTRVTAVVIALAALVGLSMAGHWWTQEGAPVLGAGEEAASVVVTDALGEELDQRDLGLVDAGANVGLLLLGSWLMGVLFTKVGLPKITGFLVFGVLMGSSVLGVVSKESLPYLTLVNDLAIALIALTAGAEIRLAELKRSLKAVLILTAVIVGGVFAVIMGGSTLVFGGLPGAGGEDGTPVWLIGLIAAPLMVANSPAVIMAMLQETGAKGPLARTSLMVTVGKDLALVVLFAVVMTYAGTRLTAEGDSEQQGLALALTQQLGGSLLGGVLVGLGMTLYLRAVGRHVPVFVVLSGFAMATVSQLLGLETLIVGLVAGMLMENAYPSRSEPMFETVEELSLPVYCVFFAVAGAKLELGSITGSLWLMAGALVAMRFAAVWVAATGGAKLAGVAKPARTWLWTAFVPQAGVSLALASIVVDTFPEERFEWSPALFNVSLAVIAFHELVGPALLKLGLVRSGEVGGSGGGSEDSTGGD